MSYSDILHLVLIDDEKQYYIACRSAKRYREPWMIRVDNFDSDPAITDCKACQRTKVFKVHMAARSEALTILLETTMDKIVSGGFSHAKLLKIAFAIEGVL